MFWIPIMFVALAVWFVWKCIDTYRNAAYDAGRNAYNARYEYLMQNYTDRKLQASIEKQYTKQYDDSQKVVREFMGGDPVWDAFAGYYLCEVKATAVLLAQQGLIFTSYLSALNTMYANGCDNAGDLIAQFMLKLEEELNRHGVGVVAMFQNRPFGSNPDPAHPLRGYISEHGSDKVYPSARFWFH